MQRIICLLFLGWFAVVPMAAQQNKGTSKKDKLAVFVGEVSSRNGFVDADPGTLDSIKDVKEALSRKHIRLVSDIDDAEVVIRILGRKKTSEDIGAFIADVGPSTITGRRYADYRILGAQIEARNYKKSLVSTDAGSWRSSARDIASQIGTWIEANLDTLLNKRDEITR